MKLVKNARKAWRWFSMQAMGLSLAGAATWLAMPQELRDQIPDTMVAAGAITVAVAGIIGRMIEQPGADG